MAAISSAGAGSGLDLNGLLQQIMATERRPLTLLNQKKSGYEAQLSDYGKLKSALSSFQTAMTNLSDEDRFKIYSTTTTDDEVVTATATATAAAGSFRINEITALAQHHKLASTTFAAETTTVGTGTLTITSNSESFDVTVSAANQTLEGVRDAINDASDNVGVTATIINTDLGYRLVLTADNSGADYQMTVAVSGDGDGNDTDAAGLSRLIWSSGGTQRLSQVDAAQDAAFKVDGYDASSTSNTVTDVVQGVTLSLLTTTGTAQTITVDRDTSEVTASVQEFATAYTDLMKTIKELRSGNLAGDSTLFTIEAGIRNVLETAPAGLSGSNLYLSSIGVSVQKDGTMEVDTTVLTDALNADFTRVSDLFSLEDEGYAVRLDELIDDYLIPNGTIDAREDGLNANIDLTETRIDSMNLRLESIEKRYRRQFGALDVLVAQLRTTGDYLSASLR